MIKSRFALILAAGAAMQFASLSQPAFAADLPGGSLKDTPYVVAPSWAGLYFGGHAGGVWGNTGVNDTFTYVGDPTSNGNIGSTGFIGGAQAGYNFQRGRFVFGPEADIGYLGLSGSKSFFHAGDAATCKTTYPGDSSPTYYSADVCNVNSKYSVSGGLYGDLTGRLGYLLDQRTLFYAKGGAAFLNADVKANYSAGNCTTSKSGCAWPNSSLSGTNQPSVFGYDHSATLAGWTVGAGVEYALASSWSLKAEYQHFDFGSMSYSYSGCVPVPGTTGNNCPDGHWTSKLNGKTDVSVTADAVTVGVNYHLNNEAGTK
jgi:outer membrane immunogenic protein